MDELIKLLEKISWFVLKAIDTIDTIDTIDIELKDNNINEIELLSAGLNFNSKYIIYKSLKMIELKTKINNNLGILDINNLNHKQNSNDELFDLYNNLKEKHPPIKITSIICSGFGGGMIMGLINDITNCFEKIKNKIYEFAKENNHNMKYYLFYAEQYEKFNSLLNHFTNSKNKICSY